MKLQTQFPPILNNGMPILTSERNGKAHKVPQNIIMTTAIY